MSSAIKTPAFQAKASNILNEDNSSIYSGGEWSFKNASAVTRVTIKDDGNCIVTTTGANYITAGGTGGFLVQDANTGGRGLITLRASSGNFQGLQFSNLSGTQTGFGFLNSSTSQVGYISDAGAWTFGPAGFTGNHVVNGNVGIGTTSIASTRFSINGGSLPTQDNGGTNTLQFAAGVTGRRANSNTVGFIGTYANASSIEISAGQTGAGISMHGQAASVNANSLIMYSGNTERMRIDSSGNVKIRNNYLAVGENTTSSYTGVFVNGIVTAYRALSTSGGGVIGANSDYYGTNTSIFQVRSEGAIYARFTSITSLSDIRFKEDVKPLTGCLSKIMQLKPSSWKWKDNRKQEMTGFIAQEIEQVFPQFVTELEESEQGVEKPKAVGAAGNEMIANLVAAIQEQQAMIEELKAKVSALESK